MCSPTFGLPQHQQHNFGVRWQPRLTTCLVLRQFVAVWVGPGISRQLLRRRHKKKKTFGIEFLVQEFSCLVRFAWWLICFGHLDDGNRPGSIIIGSNSGWSGRPCEHTMVATKFWGRKVLHRRRGWLGHILRGNMYPTGALQWQDRQMLPVTRY